ncbi:MAG: hypothetical protein U9R04_01510 [Chloroflexota bacterium]|nr:hypothetical protein [Chloroflexota bacterium]
MIKINPPGGSKYVVRCGAKKVVIDTFGAMYAHGDCELPIKCDMCGGDPKCVQKCPTNALRLIPEGVLGETKRLNNVLSYTQMREIEFYEKGEKKTIQYADIGKEEL